MTSADGTPPPSLSDLPRPPPPSPASAAAADAALRTSGLRARRSLAASKSARDSITSVVESLRVPKPPRAPPLGASSGDGASSIAARRRALLPTSAAAGGGAENSNPKVRSLEDAVASRDTETVAMKRLYGRALVKRRAAERERDRLREELAAVRRLIPATQPPTSPLPGFPASGPPTPLRNGAGGDDDVRSVRSFVSSCVFGDDREAQLEALVDLVDMLEAKLATSVASAAHARAAPAVARARATLGAAKAADPEADVVAERDALRRQLDAALAAAPEDRRVAALRVALKEARDEAAAFRARAEALARGAVTVNAGVGAEANAGTGPGASGGGEKDAMAAELEEAKKTIARLIRERNALRRMPASAPPPDTAERDGRHAPSAEVVRRVLDWRERARSEVTLPVRSVDDETRGRRLRAVAGGPVTVPVSEMRRSRMGRARGLDLRGFLSAGGNKTTAASASRGRGSLFRNRSERSANNSGAVPPPAPGAARAQRGQAHLLPDRLIADLREPVNIRRALTLSQDAMSERSVDVSEGESYASLPHGIVGRHLSFGDQSMLPAREFLGNPGHRSEGLKGLIGDSVP